MSIRNSERELDKLWDAKPNTAKGDRLEVLVTLVEAYEQKHYKIEPSDPIEAIKFRMEQLELNHRTWRIFSATGTGGSEILDEKGN